MTAVTSSYIVSVSPVFAVGQRLQGHFQGRDITNSQVTAEQTAAIIEREVGRLLQLALAAAQIPGVTPASGSVYAQSAPSAAANASAVRTELATELGRIDATVSSRLASAGYTAPDNAGIAALPTLAEIEASTVLAMATDMPDVPSAADNAAAVLAAAQATPIHANVKQQNDAAVIGSGISTDKWRGVQP